MIKRNEDLRKSSFILNTVGLKECVAVQDVSTEKRKQTKK